MPNISYLAPLNIQNPPKPKMQTWWIRLADETSNPEFTVGKWEFTLDQRSDSLGYNDEGFSVEENFRKAFLPEKGHYVVSRDFSGQELRILANMSGEPKWVEAFLNNEDIHKQTAIMIFGEENYSREKRNIAKTINFGLVYGMSEFALASKAKTSVEEAKSYIDQFFTSFKWIDRYLKQQGLLAGQNGELANYYGRKRRFHRDIDTFKGLSNAGRRRAQNFPIQSMGADIIKLSLIKLYYNILMNPKYKGKVIFMSTIHDEINLSVDGSILEEVAFELGELMYHEIPDKPVPITTDLSIGTSMGIIWEFEQDEKTLELTPVYTPVGEEKDETKERDKFYVEEDDE